MIRAEDAQRLTSKARIEREKNNVQMIKKKFEVLLGKIDAEVKIACGLCSTYVQVVEYVGDEYVTGEDIHDLERYLIKLGYRCDVAIDINGVITARLWWNIDSV